MVKVSVIVPVYNEEQYLLKCINSICSQTLKEIEIICVDDGSTDSSLEILQNMARRDSRIQILTQENKFAGAARNAGMAHATGKYLSFLDADDYFEPEMLEKMYDKAEKGNLDVVICRFARYCEDSEKTEFPDWQFIDSFFDRKEEFSGEQLEYAGIFQITNGWAWDKLFRADHVRGCGYVFPEFRSSEDGYFVYMLVTRAGRIGYMDDILLTHRANQKNSLSNTKEKDWLNGFKMLQLIMDEMNRLGIYEVYQQSFLNKAVDFLLWYLESMHSFEAYKNCYDYIQTDMEPQLGILSRDKGYYFKGDLYDWYQEINRSSLEEHLFRKKESSYKELAAQRAVIERQREALKERSWVFPYRLFEKDKTIVLYGAGKIGCDYYSQLTDGRFCKEVIWVDKRYAEHRAKGLDVQNPDVISARQIDYVCLAVKDIEAQKEITEWLLIKGIRQDQIKCYGMR